MLFNSYEFIFLFLPVVVLGFYLLGRLELRQLVLGWIVLTSLVFYGLWNPINVAIIAPSVVCNYLLARHLARMVARKQKGQSLVLALGIAANVAFLGYFKYKNFFLDTTNTLFSTHYALVATVLPLGISFITFQKIAFLADVRAGQIKNFRLFDFMVFVLFFPQLVAGPIVHYREMMPQFERLSLRLKSADLAVAVSLFSMGLFKKVVIADGVAVYANPVFDAAARGEHVSLFPAWAAALTYAFQIYFDFSGYSDMALGLARIFGIRLPVNFNSPFKASSIIEYWGRWHMTLTRFLTAYIYTPLVLKLTRRRLARGKRVLAGPHTRLPAFAILAAGPTLLTMGVSGLWHGAGFQFIVWGLLHGVLISINQGWRLVRQRFWLDQASYERIMKPLGFCLTFTCVVVALVFFRSSSVATAWLVLKGMAGSAGITLPEGIWERLGGLGPWLQSLGIDYDWSSGRVFVLEYVWAIVLFCIVTLMPNSLEILARYEPALGFLPAVHDAGSRAGWATRAASWISARSMEFTWPWAAFIATASVAGVFGLTRVSQFLYWQF